MGVQEAERYKAEDEANRGRVEAKNSLENYAFQIRNSVNDEKLAGKISEEDKTKILDAVSSTTSWLDSNQTAEKEEFEAKQKELEGICLPILQNLGGGAGVCQGACPIWVRVVSLVVSPVEGHKVLDLLRLPTTDRRLRRLTKCSLFTTSCQMIRRF